MNGNFAACWAFTAAQEGGFTDDADDAGNWTGGAVGVGTLAGTKFGISAAAYPNLNIAALTKQQAGAHMQADYWAKASCDVLPAGVDLAVFDPAVNMGVGRAARLLQAAVGVAQDGQVGPATLAAVAAMSPAAIIQAITAARIAAYEADEGFAQFGGDWITRANDCQAAALAMTL